MKNLFLGLICLLSFGAHSQNSVTTMTGSGDTLRNTTPDYMTMQLDYTHENLSIQVTLTKSSGTINASGVLQASNDGVNYYTILTDSLKATNQTTNTKIWALTDAKFAYYKVYLVGVGTMKAYFTGQVYASGSLGKHVPAYSLKSSYNLNSDTATNTGTTYVQIAPSKWYNNMTVQAVVTKLSGTAAGTVTLQGSNNGTNFVTVSSSYADATTMTVTNVTTNTKLFTITGNPYKYYRLSYTGSGTMSCTLRGYLVPNKK